MSLFSCFKSFSENAVDRMKNNGPNYKRLRRVEGFVLDNTLRESNVATDRPPTVEEKLRVLELIKDCGVKHIIVAAFSNHIRVDDLFVEALVERKIDMTNCYAFTELWTEEDKVLKKRVTIPKGFEKMKKFGIPNPIIEIDLASHCSGMTDVEHMQLLFSSLHEAIEWTYDNLSPDSKIFVNFRDFPVACDKVPERVVAFTKFLACLPRQPFGILFEDPSGAFLPSQLAWWSKIVRQTMKKYKWGHAQFLIHVHKGFGLAEASVLECLAAGCTGIWCSVCELGAVTGHACQAISLTNLLRLGNKNVADQYNFPALRTAAIETTEMFSGKEPPPATEIYGERALHTVFPPNGMAVGDFDVNRVFNTKALVRITSFTSCQMYQERLKAQFDVDCDEGVAERMRAILLYGAKRERKMNYNTSVGIVLLYEHAGGEILDKMFDFVFEEYANLVNNCIEMSKLREFFYSCRDNSDSELGLGQDETSSSAFFEHFLKAYFPDENDEKVAQCLRIFQNEEKHIPWKKVQLRAVWALLEYRPECVEPAMIVDTFMKKLILPRLAEEQMGKEFKVSVKNVMKGVRMMGKDIKKAQKHKSKVNAQKTSVQTTDAGNAKQATLSQV
mmetsp:Transcript_9042/g.12288  ORF Transcript_9042/g.12288 Transcript_9042/m.12288 type:complete len:615 (+) Transcript_9042:267-2111(+)|eukprot:CAMPEP_0196581510 /NCGR_PEP_ID=MMETSP1081-20130531/34005_1 /TAXON_ID=36882 /ORGANISM="Pyramimonas amylifera, Strain CCMP720" /LENGTH=614 /DNA_ID=CAMNT_0041901765 /DNA_START=261 /DNA_END=2105 /DNA_ORIENTATION=-